MRSGSPTCVASNHVHAREDCKRSLPTPRIANLDAPRTLHTFAAGPARVVPVDRFTMNMKENPQSMEEEQVRAVLNLHWRASAAGDADAEHDIYDDDAICEYPQSGERIVGRNNLQALWRHHPGFRSAGLAETMGSADRLTPHALLLSTR